MKNKCWMMECYHFSKRNKFHFKIKFITIRSVEVLCWEINFYVIYILKTVIFSDGFTNI